MSSSIVLLLQQILRAEKKDKWKALGLKKSCCESFRKEGRACKRCPLVALASDKNLDLLASTIKKKRAKKHFKKLYR